MSVDINGNKKIRHTAEAIFYPLKMNTSPTGRNLEQILAETLGSWKIHAKLQYKFYGQ
jgi:hypothetical protein